VPSFIEKNHFLLRRLHSLTGIVPIGVFLIAHLHHQLLNHRGASSACVREGSHYAFGADGVSLDEGGIAYFQEGSRLDQ
jgi:hypothetical protein